MDNILDIIGRVSESAYRRGYQHGVTFANDGKVNESQACNFRFDKRLCLSPPHNPKGYACSPIERLEMEACHGRTMLTYDQRDVLLKMIAGVER
jgi:hypothetical protein